jgi:hypothetical protein
MSGKRLVYEIAVKDFDTNRTFVPLLADARGGFIFVDRNSVVSSVDC